MAIDRDTLPYGRSHAPPGTFPGDRMEAGGGAGNGSAGASPQQPNQRAPSSSPSPPVPSSGATTATEAAAEAEAADSIFRKIMGRGGQYIMSVSSSFASGSGVGTSGNASPQRGVGVTPTESSDSLPLGAGAVAGADAGAGSTGAASYDIGGAYPSTASTSSRIGAPGASADSTTPLEMGQGPHSDEWGRGPGGNGGKHPGFFGKGSFANLRLRRGPNKWSDLLPPCIPRRLTRRQMALCGLAGTIFFIILIVLISAAAKRNGNDMLLPGADNGAAETGNYRNLFVEYLGKTPAEVDKKLDDVFQALFYGDAETQSIYVEVEPDMAQIINTESNVVTSEGISYGMTAAVHLDQQKEFNKLWNWARFHMQQTAGDFATFFAWRVTRGGLLIDAKDVIPAPDAEAYIAHALISAHRKWGSSVAYPYKAEAMRLLAAMGDPRKGFFTKEGKVTFNPTDWGLSHSNPSYHLPHFWESFARFLENEGEPLPVVEFWRHAAIQSRRFFHKAAHPRTGLMPDYTTLAGKKAPDPNLGGHVNFQWDAWRAPANVAVDWAWWNADGWQQKFADRYLKFFKGKGPQYESLWSVDGHPVKPQIGHDMGLVAMNSAVALAAKNRKLPPPFLGEMWDRALPTGQGRYYPAALTLLGLLHASGKFRAYY